MTLSAKIAVSFALVCMSLLILAMGRTNIRNFERVNNSIEEIYADRLVVKGLIFELAEIMHRKQIAIAERDQQFFEKSNGRLNGKVIRLLEEFRATKLTKREAMVLEDFAASVEYLKSLEKQLDLEDEASRSSVQDELDLLVRELKELSEIQLAEGYRRMAVSEIAVRAMNRNSWVGVIMFSTAAMLILAIIFFIPRLPSRSAS